MKQPEALRLADGNEECAKAWLESSDAHKFRKETAAELRRLHAIEEAAKTLVKVKGRYNTEQAFNKLKGLLT